MFRKIKEWWSNRRLRRQTVKSVTKDTFTRAEVIELLEQAKQIAYNDGRKDGLAIARQQATKSLKEILWQQNQQPARKQTLR